MHAAGEMCINLVMRLIDLTGRRRYRLPGLVSGPDFHSEATRVED